MFAQTSEFGQGIADVKKPYFKKMQGRRRPARPGNLPDRRRVFHVISPLSVQTVPGLFKIRHGFWEFGLHTANDSRNFRDNQGLVTNIEKLFAA